MPRVLLLIDYARAWTKYIGGILCYAHEHGPWSIQIEDRSLDLLPKNWLKQWQGDGIISRTVNAKLVKILQTAKQPVVELHGDGRLSKTSIGCDDDALGRMAVNHFLDCGLRHFGYCTFVDCWWIPLHRDAFCRAVEEAGYSCHCYRPPPEAAKEQSPAWHERQRAKVAEWVASLPQAIGIYTALDQQAIQLLEICRELNIAVPESVAILGTGNLADVCTSVRPTLSSIDCDTPRLAYEAARLLDRLMAGEKPSKEMILTPPSHIVVRQSTDIMALEDLDVVEAMRFIRQNACSGIDVADVAQKVGISRSVLQRRFKHYLKRTPKAEIMRVRIENAKSLLVKTGKTSEGIARKCGFTSVTYFKQAFHREVGMTPGKFRQLRQRME